MRRHIEGTGWFEAKRSSGGAATMGRGMNWGYGERHLEAAVADGPKEDEPGSGMTIQGSNGAGAHSPGILIPPSDAFSQPLGLSGLLLN